MMELEEVKTENVKKLYNFCIDMVVVVGFFVTFYTLVYTVMSTFK